MASPPSRRSTMTLFSSATDPSSHRVRIVLREKNIPAEVVVIGDNDPVPEDVLEINPYRSLPTLIDRDLAIYSAPIVMEFFDERYPHPPLLPIDPIGRARSRVLLYRIERDWYSAIDAITGPDEAMAQDARAMLRDSLHSIAPMFDEKPYFMSDEFSMVDCSIAPILWRLGVYGIKLDPHAKPLRRYAQRLFARDGFKKSLTDAEREFGLD